MKNCPNCNNSIPDNAKFCTHCGTNLENAKLCPSCGKPLKEGARFCVYCGQKFGEKIVTPTSEPQQTVTLMPEQLQLIEEEKAKREEDRLAEEKSLQEYVQKKRREYEEEKRRNKLVGIIILSIALVIIGGGLAAYHFLHSPQKNHDEDIVEHTDSIISIEPKSNLEEIEIIEKVEMINSILPTFSEIRDFMFNEKLTSNLKEKGMQFITEYKEDREYEEDEDYGPMQHDSFYGINADVTYERYAVEEYENYTQYEVIYSFKQNDEHSLIIGIYSCSDTIPVVYFSNKSDWEKCKEQAIESGEDMEFWEFETANNSSMEGWYIMRYLQ